MTFPARRGIIINRKSIPDIGIRKYSSVASEAERVGMTMFWFVIHEKEADMKEYPDFTREELKCEMEKLQESYQEFCRQHLSLDLSRGKPSNEQLSLSLPLLSLPEPGDYYSEDGTDVRNYNADIRGLPEVRRWFAELFRISPDLVLPGGNSSLALIHDALSRAFIFGPLPGFTPWGKLEKVKFICPVPGYDWHFHTLDQFGIEMISVDTGTAGPDINLIRELVKDPDVKGMICVPMYGNPSGVTWSDDLVEGLARMETAAPDFRIIWDNAYMVHHLYDTPEQQDHLANIYDLCVRYGHEDRVLMFTSTSKMTFAGAGIAAMAASPANLAEALRIIHYRLVCYDKINQLRHIRFLPDKAAVAAHMKKHAAILRPKFEYIEGVLGELRTEGLGDWHSPKGGYFICYYALPGCAKRIVELCGEMGVTLTPAGAAYPHDFDPRDSAIRLAPSFANPEELPLVMKVFVTAVRMAAVEKLLKNEGQGDSPSVPDRREEE